MGGVGPASLVRFREPEDPEPHLPKVAGALRASPRRPDHLHGGQRQRDEHGDDGDHDEQFHERECPPRRDARPAVHATLFHVQLFCVYIEAKHRVKTGWGNLWRMHPRARRAMEANVPREDGSSARLGPFMATAGMLPAACLNPGSRRGHEQFLKEQNAEKERQNTPRASTLHLV